MYTEDLVAFLEDLRANNNKPWFDANRKRYDALRSRFLNITNEIIADAVRFDADLTGIEAVNCVFRINRDVRFSADKSPYKTTFSAVLTPGKKGNPHGYYYCFDAEGSLEIGAGIYMPDAPTLLRIRKAIAENGEALDDLLHAQKLVQTFGEMDGARLKTAPRDFPADHPYIDYLRCRSFTLGRTESATALADGSIAPHVADLFETAAPFVKYLRAVLT